MNVRGRMVRALAALVVGAAGGTVVSAGAAFAAACPAGTGVTVVVNSSVRCDANGGGAAASNFAAAGHSLNSSRGFVCDIDGYPSSAPCRGTAPPDAYWGLFSANGTGGGWNYASQGAYSLSVPKGGWVAFKFQNSSSRTYPGMRPYTPPPAPAPKPKAAAAPKPKASTSVEGKKATPSPSASATASKGSKSSSAAPSPSASASATAAAAAREEELQRTSQQSDDSSTPTLWVGSLLALTLLIGMGVTFWQRRARRS